MARQVSFSGIAVAIAFVAQLLLPVACAAALGTPDSFASAGVDTNAELEKRNPPAILTMTLQNRAHQPVQLDFINSVESGNEIIGHPQFSKGTIPAGGNMDFGIPINWQGTIGVGPQGNPDNTLIEGNTLAGDLNFDVSYVQGYSYSVTCWCGGPVVTGCNLDLHSMGKCLKYVAPGICQNPVRGIHDKIPHPFFAPCQHMAFAYPDDGQANAIRTCWPKEHVTCCIGGKDNPCPPHPRQQ